MAKSTKKANSYEVETFECLLNLSKPKTTESTEVKKDSKPTHVTLYPMTYTDKYGREYNGISLMVYPRATKQFYDMLSLLTFGDKKHSKTDRGMNCLRAYASETNGALMTERAKAIKEEFGCKIVKSEFMFEHFKDDIEKAKNARITQESAKAKAYEEAVAFWNNLKK